MGQPQDACALAKRTVVPVGQESQTPVYSMQPNGHLPTPRECMYKLTVGVSKLPSNNKANGWLFSGLAWGHLLRPEDVYVEMFPAGCATPVPAGFHVDPSIATLRHQADPVHRDTAC